MFLEYRRVSNLYPLLAKNYVLVEVVAREWNQGDPVQLMIHFFKEHLGLPRFHLDYATMSGIKNIIALLIDLRAAGLLPSELSVIKNAIPLGQPQVLFDSGVAQHVVSLGLGRQLLDMIKLVQSYDSLFQEDQ